MTPLPKCGCRIKIFNSKWDATTGGPVTTGEIAYCALHRSAPALLEALKRILNRRFTGNETINDIAEAAIAEAGK